MFGDLFGKTLVNEEVHKGDDIAAFTNSWVASVVLNVCMRIAG